MTIPRITTIATLAAGIAVALPASATTVVANNTAPGDSFTNAGGGNMGLPVGATGWYYNNVRNSGAVGIHTSNPRSGNASAVFSSPSGAAKADIEYLSGGVLFGGNYFASTSLGPLSSLTNFGLDWYRDSGSTTLAHFHPVIRVLLDADGNLSTSGDRGGLVFERAYNSLPTPAGQWVTDSVTGTTNVWNFGLGLGFAFDIGGDGYAYDDTFAEWKAYLPNAVILGFSSGVGSGWNDTFTGAVDNINWMFGSGPSVTSNFEVVPEPASMLALGAGVLALARRRRKA